MFVMKYVKKFRKKVLLTSNEGKAVHCSRDVTSSVHDFIGRYK